MNNTLYDYTPLYYSSPVKVKYFNNNAETNPVKGICYLDKLIDWNTGALLDIEEIILQAKLAGIHFDNAIVECDWSAF